MKSSRFQVLLCVLATSVSMNTWASNKIDYDSPPAFKPADTKAAAPSWDILGVASTGCNSGDFQFNIDMQLHVSGLFPHTIVDVGGARYMNEQFEDPSTSRGGTWGLFDVDQGGIEGPTTGTWPIPADTPVSIAFIIRESFDGPILFQRDLVLDSCNNGVILSDSVAGSSPSIPVPSMGNISTSLLILVLLGMGGIAIRRINA